jgi:hypothetical protein
MFREEKMGKQLAIKIAEEYVLRHKDNCFGSKVTQPRGRYNFLGSSGWRADVPDIYLLDPVLMIPRFQRSVGPTDGRGRLRTNSDYMRP